MSQPTCTIDGCGRPHQARGMCSSHYSQWHRKANGRRKREKVCAGCGETWLTEVKTSRFCSQFCQVYFRLGPQSCAWKPPRPITPKVIPFEPVERSCQWCGEAFAARRAAQVYCSPDHKLRSKRNRRRGREYGWTSNFTWSEVMKVWRKLDRQCAYCAGVIDGLPDPDHVVPLSRGGSNSITNILPCCSPCNSDKRDLLLSEWNGDRERRGLPPRRTSWAVDDPRVSHLTVLLPMAAA